MPPYKGHAAVLERTHTPQTKTSPDRVQPERSAIVTDSLKSRVVLVCPYSTFNSYIGEIVPQFVKGAYVETVSMADTDKPPWYDAQVHEQNSPSPLWVIDFHRIIARRPDPHVLSLARAQAISSLLQNYGQKFTADEKTTELLRSALTSSAIAKITHSVVDGVRNHLAKNLENELSLVEAACRDPEILRWRTTCFMGYNEWVAHRSTTDRILYIVPHNDVMSDLIKAERADECGGFLPLSVDVTKYRQSIRFDLEAIARGRTGELRLFDVRKCGRRPEAVPQPPELPPWIKGGKH